MVKRKSELSRREKVVKKKRKSIEEEDGSDIDFSDLPELTDEELASMKRIGRPLFGILARQPIAIRVDPIVLERIREIAKDEGKGYQTLINDILAKYVDKNSA